MGRACILAVHVKLRLVPQFNLSLSTLGEHVKMKRLTSTAGNPASCSRFHAMKMPRLFILRSQIIMGAQGRFSHTLRG